MYVNGRFGPHHHVYRRGISLWPQAKGKSDLHDAYEF